MNSIVSDLTPISLAKYHVGDQIAISFKTSKHGYLFELYTNINRSYVSYPFTRQDQSYTCKLNINSSGFFKWSIRYKVSPHSPWLWLTGPNETKLVGKIQVDPQWIQNAIVYNVFVRFFKGAVAGDNTLVKPGDGGTFDDVKGHLDELKKMHINTLYFNPIHLIGDLYRKHNHIDNVPDYLQPGSPYSIKDFKSIDPELTYDKDTKKHLLSDPAQEFKDLVDAAHHRGMYVIMDLVFNHTAHDFVFQRIKPEWYLYKENITSLDEPYIHPHEIKQGKPWGDPKHTMSPYDHGVWWEDAAQLNWEYMIPPGPNLPPKNNSIDEMWQYFKSIPKYWIKHFGIDGFRCDIAYRIPTKFWKECIAEARSESHIANNNLAGDVIFIAESFTDKLRQLQEAGFTAVYSDYSNKLNTPNQLKGYLDYIYNISGNHFPEGSKWFIFPECHDFNRAPQKILGDSARSDTDASLRANRSRWLLTATLPGIPLIFNGFEKIEWQPINLFSYGAVDWERDADLRKFISKINKIRSENPELTKGEYAYIESSQGLNDQTQLITFSRKFYDQEIIVVINMDVHNEAGPTLINLPHQFNSNYTLTDLLTSKNYQRTGQHLTVKLAPGDAHVFKVAF